MCFLVSLCVSARLSASCHVVTCFFVVVVVVVHFSLVTTLFCFISLDTLLGNFFVVVLSVYVCVFLHLSASWQDFLHRVMSRRDPLLMLFISHSWQLSLFYFIRYNIGQLFCGCIECLCVCFLASLCDLQFLIGFLHRVTSQLVSLLMFLISHS